MPIIVDNTIQAEADLRIQIAQQRNIQQNYTIGSTGWTTGQTAIAALYATYLATYGTLGRLPGGNLDLGGQ